MMASPITCRLISASKKAEYAKVRQIRGEANRLRKLIGRSAPQLPHHASGMDTWIAYITNLRHKLIGKFIPQPPAADPNR